MSFEELNKMIDDLYKELDNRPMGESWITDYKNEDISLDTGYAFEGIRFFIEELKHKLKLTECNYNEEKENRNYILDIDSLIYDNEDGQKLRKYILNLQKKSAYSKRADLILSSFIIWLRGYENKYISDFFIVLRLSEIKEKLQELEKRYKYE